MQQSTDPDQSLFTLLLLSQSTQAAIWQFSPSLCLNKYRIVLRSYFHREWRFMASFFLGTQTGASAGGGLQLAPFSQYRRRGLSEKREISILLIEFSRCTCHFLRRTGETLLAPIPGCPGCLSEGGKNPLIELLCEGHAHGVPKGSDQPGDVSNCE